MKTRLNLTVEESLLRATKNFAQKQHTSVSELVEGYFKTIAKSHSRKNIIDVIEELDRPSIAKNEDLKKQFYIEQGKKYGF